MSENEQTNTPEVNETPIVYGENTPIVVLVNGKEYIITLRPPGFDELAAAYNALLSGMARGGVNMPNMPRAGKVLLDTCTVEAETDKMFYDLRLGPRLMFSAALEAAKLVEAFESEIKKK